MPTKKAIKIALTEKEEALLHYESYFGKNASVKTHARILYEAGQEQKAGQNFVNVRMQEKQQ